MNFEMCMVSTSNTKQMSITEIKNLDISSLSFSDVKIDANTKAKRVFVNNNKGKVIIQTPKMYVPNGIKRWRKPDAVDNKDDSFEVELSFGGNSESVKMFHEKMIEYDNVVKSKIQENSLTWIGKQKVSMETIEDAFYTPTVKLALDKDKQKVDYPDRMRIKIDRDRNGDEYSGNFISNKKFGTKVLAYDHNKEELEFNESNFEKVIPKGCHIICILELVYIFSSKQVSTKWKLVQFKVFRSDESISSYAIKDEDEDEVAKQETESEEIGLEEELRELELAETSELEEAVLVVEEEPVKKTTRKKKVQE